MTPKRMSLRAALLMVEHDSSGIRMVEIEARLEAIARSVKALEAIAPQLGKNKGLSVGIDRECCLKTIARVAGAIESALDSKTPGEMSYWSGDIVRCYEHNARMEEQREQDAKEAEQKARKLALVKSAKGWKRVELRDGRKVWQGISDKPTPTAPSAPTAPKFDPCTD